MAQATRAELIDMMQQGLHRQTHISLAENTVISGARSGSYYFLPSRPSDAELAQTTGSTLPQNNLEVALLCANGHYFISVGSAGDATASIPNFPRSPEHTERAIISYQFLAITHPRDHPSFANGSTRFHAAFTANDRRAIARLEQDWGRQNPYAIVTQSGQVEGSRLHYREVQSREFTPDSTSAEEERRFRELMDANR